MKSNTLLKKSNRVPITITVDEETIAIVRKQLRERGFPVSRFFEIGARMLIEKEGLGNGNKNTELGRI